MHTGKNTKMTFADLDDIMQALRDPETGCPWDLKQNFASIAPYTIEEAYEVADAIARDDLIDLEEELGDLLLQVVYHAQIAREADAFAIDDVVDGIARKMIRRHPHVFGTPKERAAGMAPGAWERIKDDEKRQKAERRGDLEASQLIAQDGAETETATTANATHWPTDKPGALDGVPPALPALARAVKLQSKAARVGFDWPCLDPVLAKMREELAELDQAGTDGDAAQQAEEFGDLMFVMANVARHMAIDPEAVLQAANAKFERRFRSVEAKLAQRGLTPSQSDLAAMDALWDEVKNDERSGQS